MPTLPSPSRLSRPRLRDASGQAVVEFAVVLPVLLLVVFGILYFGRYESYANQMTQLAEVGARDAAVDYTGYSSSGYSSLAAYIAGQATGELAAGSSDVDAVSVRVNCLYSTGVCTAGTNVVVCVQSRVRFPALGLSAGTIYQRATMRVETTGFSDLVNPTAGPNPPSC